jgi:AraC family ethanolamine operon transcriptional activator
MRDPRYTETPPAVRTNVVRQARSQDLEEHTQLLLDWNLEYDQLDCGRFEGEFLDVRLAGLQLFQERTNRCLRQRGGLGPSSFSVAMMLSGEGELLINGVRPGRDGLAAVNNGELELTSPAECTLAGVVVDEHLLQQTATDMLGRPLDLRRGMVTGVTTEEDRTARFMESLRSSLSRAKTRQWELDDPAAQIEMRDAILVQLVRVLDDARDADAAGRASQRKWLVDRACALMMDRLDDQPSLEDVCQTIGASARKLNYCFQDALGMSPNRYIRALRLNAARRELRRCRDDRLSVYEVAANWGFWHFGRFSGDYKRQFCESPSESLRRARVSSRHTLNA